MTNITRRTLARSAAIGVAGAIAAPSCGAGADARAGAW